MWLEGEEQDDDADLELKPIFEGEEAAGSFVL